MIKWSKGNTKLEKTSGGAYNVIGFGIPADHTFNGLNTCPGASACKAVCYAKQGRYRMPNVANSKLNNLEETLKASFVTNAVESLKKEKRYDTVRIHDAGDFYSQEYYDQWIDIARALPEHIFYAYTKALHLDLYSNLPENFRIVQSLGGKYDNLVDMNKPHSRIFATEAARLSAGYVDGNVNDVPAIEGDINIGLVYHGVKKLTLPQINYFS